MLCYIANTTDMYGHYTWTSLMLLKLSKVSCVLSLCHKGMLQLTTFEYTQTCWKNDQSMALFMTVAIQQQWVDFSQIPKDKTKLLMSGKVCIVWAGIFKSCHLLRVRPLAQVTFTKFHCEQNFSDLANVSQL